jgi:hypothetical protein
MVFMEKAKKKNNGILSVDSGNAFNPVWRLTLVIPALGRLRQEDQEFRPSCTT